MAGGTPPPAASDPCPVPAAPEAVRCPLPAELKKQVESAELKNQRLKEVFQTKVQEFRKVCYTLTGYQVDITRESQYRLTSMYAEHKDDCLVFKVGCPRRAGVGGGGLWSWHPEAWVLRARPLQGLGALWSASG